MHFWAENPYQMMLKLLKNSMCSVKMATHTHPKKLDKRLDFGFI